MLDFLLDAFFDEAFLLDDLIIELFLLDAFLLELFTELLMLDFLELIDDELLCVDLSTITFCFVCLPLIVIWGLLSTILTVIVSLLIL